MANLSSGTTYGTTDTVTSTKLNNQVNNATISDIQGSEIANGAINAARLATDAVETTKIKALNVTAAKLATDSVETDKILNDNVTNDKLADDFKITDWTAYQETSTIVGWSSFTTKIIRYKKIGNIVYVLFDLAGTSNSTAATFTLAVASASNGMSPGAALHITQDNGSQFTTPGRVVISVGTANVSTQANSAAGVFTNSGTKRITGQFWYETA